MHRITPGTLHSTPRYLVSWTASVLIHGLALGSFLALAPALTVTLLEPEPFRWDVSLVQAPAETSEPELSSPPPTPPTRTQTKKIREPRQVQVVDTRTVEPVKTEVTPVAREPIKEVVPKEIEPVSHMTASIQRPAEPVETPQPVQETAPSPAMAEPAADVKDTPLPRAQEPPAAAPAPREEVREAPPRPGQAHADYGWLAKALWHRVAQLKRYPLQARLRHLEGKVVLRAVIREDGHLHDVTVLTSSGHQVLDDAAMEIIRQACPLEMHQPLGMPQVVVQVPINYQLRQ